MAIYREVQRFPVKRPVVSPTECRPAALRQRSCDVSRACHGARAMHHAGRFACLISAPAAPHAEAVAAVKCRSRHGKASRGGSRLVCIFYFSHRWPRRADAQRATLRCGGALARARQLLPPPARRAHARLHQEGHRQRALIRQGRPRTLCASDSAQASLSGVSRFDRSCRERVTAHTGGFAGLISGPAVRMRRLWMQ